MLCDNCRKKEANIHYTEISNNITKEMHLCPDCAQKKGIGEISFSEEGLDISDFLPALVDSAHTVNAEDEKVCPGCSWTYSKFKKIGRLGCNNCYEVFSKQLAPLIRRIHGRSHHIGKIPELNRKEIIRQKELLDLKKSLKKVIREEKYEEAAIVRDRINLLEKES